MLSNTDNSIPVAPQQSAPSDAQRLLSSLKSNLITYFNFTKIEQDIDKIEQASSPAAAAVEKLELLKKLEVANMFCVKFFMTNTGYRLGDVFPEYKKLLACIDSTVSASSVVGSFHFEDLDYKPVFDLEAETFYQRNIITIYLNFTPIMRHLIQGNYIKDHITAYNSLYLKIRSLLESLRFIQELLIKTLQEQEPLKNKIHKIYRARETKPIIQQHNEFLLQFLQERIFGKHYYHAEITLPENPVDAISAIELRRLNQINIFKMFNRLFYEKLNVPTTRSHYFTDAQWNLTVSKPSKVQGGHNFLETPAVNQDPRHLQELAAFRQVNLLACWAEQESVWAMLSNGEVRLSSYIIESELFYTMQAFDYMMQRLKMNRGPEGLLTPTVKGLTLSLDQKNYKKHAQKLEKMAKRPIHPFIENLLTELEGDKVAAEDLKKTSISLKFIDTDLKEAQTQYRTMYRDVNLRRLATQYDAKDFREMAEDIDTVLIPALDLAHDYHRQLAESKNSKDQCELYIKLTKKIIYLATEVTQMKNDMNNHYQETMKLAKKEKSALEANLAKEKSLPVTETVKEKKENKKTDKVRMKIEEKKKAKQEEQQLLEDKARARREEQKASETKRESREEKPVPPRTEPKSARPMATRTISRPTSDNQNTDLDERVRIGFLNEACKNLIYIRLLAATTDFDYPAIKHFALVYNIFRCFQSLKMYQSRGAQFGTYYGDDVTDMRNMLIHHGFNAVCRQSVEDFAKTFMGELPKAISDLSNTDLFQKVFDDDARHALVMEFGLVPRNSTFTSFFFSHSKIVMEDTILYHKLKKFHEEKLPEEMTDDTNRLVLEKCIPLMKQILQRINKTDIRDRYLNARKFVDNYLFEIQALRMLTTICGELKGSYNNPDEQMSHFLEKCRQTRNTVAHHLVDMDTPVTFVGQIAMWLNHIDENALLQKISAPNHLSQNPAGLFHHTKSLIAEVKTPSDSKTMQPVRS